MTGLVQIKKGPTQRVVLVEVRDIRQLDNCAFPETFTFTSPVGIASASAIRFVYKSRALCRSVLKITDARYAILFALQNQTPRW